MFDAISMLNQTPVPTILVVGGILFILLSLVGQFVGEIQVPAHRQRPLGIVGVFFLFLGIIIYMIPSGINDGGGIGQTLKTVPPQDNEEIPVTVAAATTQPPESSDTPTLEPTVDYASSLFVEAQGWEPVLFDRFENNDNEWSEGTETWDDVGLEHTWEFIDGKYFWQTKNLDEGNHFSWVVPLASDPVNDFYVSVEIDYSLVETNSAAGVVFRRSGNNFYVFQLQYDLNSYFFSCRSYIDSEWNDLIGWIVIDNMVNKEAINKLVVIAQGEDFYFYINDHYVGNASDDGLSIGNVGLLTNIWGGDELIYQFDNFILRVNK